MRDNQQYPPRSTSQLQEAIDTIVQSFGHPGAISVDYTFEDGQKRTTIEIPTEEDRVVYELIYDGQDDNAEPELRPVDSETSAEAPE